MSDYSNASAITAALLAAAGAPADAPITTPADAPARYTVRGMVEIAKKPLPPVENVWNGIIRMAGAVIEIIGAPGIGKSRWLADLARHQILGWDFGRIPTLNKSLKWLFVGSENGIRRLQYEARRFLFGEHHIDNLSERELLYLASERGITETGVTQLQENYRTFTLEDPADCYISLADETNRDKLIATLTDEKPHVVVFDPWGDVIAGKELDDGDVRETIRIIRKIERDAGLDNALTFIINHARIGAREEAMAKGMDAGNFGKNSKALYSSARNVWNIRRASFDDNPPIEVICAKNNDGKKPPSLAFKLDPETMSYNHYADFDADAWQTALEEKAGIKHYERTRTSGDDIRKHALDICAAASEPLTATDFKNALMSKVGGKKTAVENFLSAAFHLDKLLARTPKRKSMKDGTYRRDGRKEVVSTPAIIAAYEKNHPLTSMEESV